MKSKLTWLWGKKWLLGILIIILAGSGIFIAKSRQSVQPTFATVQSEDLKQEISASGTLTGKNSADLHFQTGGKLAYLNVKAGDQVSSGETLAGLDTSALGLNLQQAQSVYDSDQAALQKVLDDIHLFQYGNGGFSNVGSANETQTQRAQRIAAEQTANSALDSVKEAQVALNNSVISSPIDGVVTEASFLPGQNVSPVDTIVKVVDFSNGTEFDADVDESDISNVSVGQRAEVTLNSYGDRIFYGTVTEIVPQTHTASNGATVVTVKITLNDPIIKNIAGLNGQVNIIQAQKKALAIPQEALINGNTVIVKNGNKLEKKQVQTGFKTDTDIEVKLPAGTEVVTNPSDVKVK